MDYASAISKLLSVTTADTIGLNTLIEANACDKLDQGKLDVNSAGQLTWRGAALSGPASDMPAVLNAPGFWMGSLVSDGSTPFVVSPQDFPSVLRSPFTYSAISDLIGSGAVKYLDAIIALHSDKLRPSHLLPDDEMSRVIALCQAGVVCVPASAATLNNLYRLFPDLPRVPVFDDGDQARGLDAWAKVILCYEESRRQYLARQYQAAADLATAAANVTDRWDDIYHAVEKVAAPAIELGLAPASDNYHAVFDLTNFRNLALLAGVAAAVVFLGPPLIAAIAKGKAQAVTA